MNKNDIIYIINEKINKKLIEYEKFKKEYANSLGFNKIKYFVLKKKINKIKNKYNNMNRNNVLFNDIILELNDIYKNYKKIQNELVKSNDENEKKELEEKLRMLKDKLFYYNKTKKIKAKNEFLKLGKVELFQNELVLNSIISNSENENNFLSGLDTDVKFIKFENTYYTSLPLDIKIIKFDSNNNPIINDIKTVNISLFDLMEYFTFFKLSTSKKSKLKLNKICRYLENVLEKEYYLNEKDIKLINSDISILKPNEISTSNENKNEKENEFENRHILNMLNEIYNDFEISIIKDISIEKNIEDIKTLILNNEDLFINKTIEKYNQKNKENQDENTKENVVKVNENSNQDIEKIKVDIKRKNILLLKKLEYKKNKNEKTINNKYLFDLLNKFIIEENRNLRITPNGNCYINKLKSLNTNNTYNYDLENTLYVFIMLLLHKANKGNNANESNSNTNNNEYYDYISGLKNYIKTNKYEKSIYLSDAINTLIELVFYFFKKHIYQIMSKKKKSLFMYKLDELIKNESDIKKKTELFYNYIKISLLKTLIKLQDISTLLKQESINLKENRNLIEIEKKVYGKINLNNLVNDMDILKLLPHITNYDIFNIVLNKIGTKEKKNTDDINEAMNITTDIVRILNSKIKLTLNFDYKPKSLFGKNNFDYEMYFFKQDDVVLEILNNVLNKIINDKNNINKIKFDKERTHSLITINNVLEMMNLIRVLRLYISVIKDESFDLTLYGDGLNLVKSNINFNNLYLDINKDCFYIKHHIRDFELKLCINEKIDIFLKKSDEEIRNILTDEIKILLYKFKNR